MDEMNSGFDELAATEAELMRRRAERMARDEAARDIAEIAATPAGVRFFSRLLKGLGLGRKHGTDAASVALYNLAHDIYREIAEASPGRGMGILASCYDTQLAPLNNGKKDKG